MTMPQFASMAVASVACVLDVRTRRIPNVLTLGAAAVALGFHASAGGASAFGTSVVGWLFGMACFFPFFALGGLGAGDVKLLGAFGAWLGPADVAGVAVFSAIAGAALACASVVATGYARQAFHNVWGLLCFWRVMGFRPMPALTLEHGSGPRLAYAVPMLAGLVAKVWWQ
jgi:prepilin peptidase CpaA